MNTASTSFASVPTFSTPFEWHDRIDVTLEFLQDPAFAIRFALDHVDPGMVRDFMEDWQEDRGAGTTSRLRHVLEGMREDLTYGQPAAAEEEAVPETPFEPDYSDLRAFNRSLATQRKQREAGRERNGTTPTMDHHPRHLPQVMTIGDLKALSDRGLRAYFAQPGMAEDFAARHIKPFAAEAFLKAVASGADLGVWVRSRRGDEVSL